MTRHRLAARFLRPGMLSAPLLSGVAVALLALHRNAYTGAEANWNLELAAWSCIVILSVLMPLFLDRYSALGVLAVEAALAFMANLPDEALLMSRYLLYGSLAAQAVTVFPDRWKMVLVALLMGEFLLVQHVLPGMTEPRPAPEETMIALLILGLWSFLLHLLQRSGRRIHQLEQTNHELHEAVHQLANANTVFLEQAKSAGDESAATERHRITRELHDVVGQTLTNLIMMMDAALHRKVHEPEETVQLLRWVRSQAKTGLEETRAVLYELRAIKTDRPRGVRFFKQLFDTFGRLSRMKVRVEWGNLPWKFHPDQEVALYHVIQQALSNAFKHGTATQVDIYFQILNNELFVMIRDNGKGGADSSPGIGQSSMNERLSRWGGRVEFHAESFGYVVNATLPLLEVEDESLPNPDRR